MILYRLDRWYDRLRLPRRWLRPTLRQVDWVSTIADVLVNDFGDTFGWVAMGVVVLAAVTWTVWLWLRQW